jgi:hypothetical protein
MVSTCFTLCHVTKSLEKKYGFLLVVIFGPPTLTTEKSYIVLFLMDLGHMCKTPLIQ